MKIGKLGKMSMFVVLALVIAGIFLTVATVPKMLIEVWKYMGSDVGYKWVINMAVGFIVAIIVRIICKKAQYTNTVANLIAAALMLIMIVVCECVIWHSKEFGELITSRLTIHKVAYMGLGILAAIISYLVVEYSTKKEGAPQPTPESKPETVEEGGSRRRRGSNARNDPMKQ